MIFFDFINLVKELGKKFFDSRILIFGLFSAFMFSVLISRLFTLQIVQGDSHQEEYQQTSNKTVEEDYTRGVIYDRNGKVLAYNKLSYNVELVDDDSYNAYQRNEMILRLINILDKHKETYNPVLPIIYENGEYKFTTTSERAHARFLEDVGIYSSDPSVTIQSLKHPVDWYTADYVVEQLANRYGVGYTIVSGVKTETYFPDAEQLLKIIDIRYALALNSGQKYVAAVIAKNVSDSTVSDIMEHEYNLLGVSVATDSTRTYVDAKYFAHIIGYTGQISQEELENSDEDYSAGDIVGKTGIEYSFEHTLKGTKGTRKLIVNNQGLILSESEEKEPEAGGDVYLTIDANYQKAIYMLLERHLAGILASKIVNYDFEYTKGMASSKIMIPVKDVYYQLIHNNILDKEHFKKKKASTTEQQLYEKYVNKRKSILNSVRSILLDENSGVNTSYNNDIETTLNYVFSSLQSNGILKKEEIDTKSDVYVQWTSDKISLREFLLHALTKGWIDVTTLEIQGIYADTDKTMNALVDKITEILKEDKEFQDRIYRFLIDSEQISGRDLCIALYDQKVLKMDDTEYQNLNNGETSAYSFIIRKIKSLELTPAQLALDPCSGSVVMTDTSTGEVLALVTYPSYDNNLITSDSSYLASLNTDLSLPLYSRATQTKTAPGSIFKPITALAGLKEGVLGVNEKIKTASNGVFTGAGYKLACNVAPSNHGSLAIPEALQKSCNYFFSEVAYRLALTSSGKYNEQKGVDIIKKYAEAFGLGANSGIEIAEAKPQVTSSDAVPSGIGQGTHNYTNTQINRYLSAIATRGKVMDLNLMLKTTDHAGNLIEKNKKTVVNKLSFTTEQWNAVYQGMYNVVNATPTYKSWFSSVPVTVAGKTGTAQENKSRGNHANFICFAPYENPEVAVSVSIPYGYTAANSVSVASDVMKLYYGVLKLKDITKSDASHIAGSTDPAD